jgi:glucosamine--fructose-6-phosphate aminotransferase (isomerizing)
MARIDAFKMLQGFYAVLAISEDARRVVAVRKDLPLVIGLVVCGTIFASDASVLLRWTQKVIYLRNYDVAVACKREVVLRNLMIDEGIAGAENTASWDNETARNKGLEKSTKHLNPSALFTEKKTLET